MAASTFVEGASEPVSQRVPTRLTAQGLVQRYGNFVFRVIRRTGLDDAATEDATQQVFLTAVRKLAAIEHGKETGFLYRTAMNVAADVRRSARRVALVEFAEDTEDGAAFTPNETLSPEELVDRERARRMVDQILSAMPDKFRDVFVLCEIEEMSASEAATCLDIPQGTVASRLLRARELFDDTLHRLQARRTFVRNTP